MIKKNLKVILLVPIFCLTFLFGFTGNVSAFAMPTLELPSITSLKELKELVAQVQKYKKQIEKTKAMINDEQKRQEFLVSMAYGKLDKEQQAGVDMATNMIKEDENGNYVLDEENAVGVVFGDDAEALYNADDWQEVFNVLTDMADRGIINTTDVRQAVKDRLNNQLPPGINPNENNPINIDEEDKSEEKTVVQSSNDATVDESVPEIEYKDKNNDGQADTIQRKQNEDNGAEIEVRNDENNNNIPDNIDQKLKQNPQATSQLIEKYKKQKRLQAKQNWIAILLDDYNTNYRMWLRNEENNSWYKRKIGPEAKEENKNNFKMGLVDKMAYFEKMVNQNAKSFQKNKENMPDYIYKRNTQSNLILQNKILLEMYKTLIDTNRVLYPFLINKMQKNSSQKIEQLFQETQS